VREILFGLAALPFLTNVALAVQPLSDVQLENITAGAFSLPSFANFPGFTTLPGLTTSSNSVSSSPDFSDSTSQAGLGEAGLTGAARLGEYLGVGQFLNHK